jgi:hypothetical protein
MTHCFVLAPGQELCGLNLKEFWSTSERNITVTQRCRVVQAFQQLTNDDKKFDELVLLERQLYTCSDRDLATYQRKVAYALWTLENLPAESYSLQSIPLDEYDQTMSTCELSCERAKNLKLIKRFLKEPLSIADILGGKKVAPIRQCHVCGSGVFWEAFYRSGDESAVVHYKCQNEKCLVTWRE